MDEFYQGDLFRQNLLSSPPKKFEKGQKCKNQKNSVIKKNHLVSEDSSKQKKINCQGN
jgi:hypothetical protein